jgi:hypothetical protein
VPLHIRTSTAAPVDSVDTAIGHIHLEWELRACPLDAILAEVEDFECDVLIDDDFGCNDMDSLSSSPHPAVYAQRKHIGVLFPLGGS